MPSNKLTVKKFSLEIELGNDAMLTARDVAWALLSVSQSLMDKGWHAPHKIKDENGNSVGRISVEME